MRPWERCPPSYMYRRTTASGADVDVEEDDENDDERVGPMGMPTRSDDDAFTRGSVRYSRSLVALASSSDATDATTTTTDVRRFEDDEDGVAIGAMRGNDEYDDDDARRSGVAKGRKGGDASDSARGVVETMANAIATMVATGVMAGVDDERRGRPRPLHLLTDPATSLARRADSRQKKKPSTYILLLSLFLLQVARVE